MEDMMELYIYLISDLLNFITYLYIFRITLTLKKNGKLYILILILLSFLSVGVFKTTANYSTGAISIMYIFAICFIAYKEKYYLKLLVLVTTFIIQYLIEILCLVVISSTNNSAYLDFFTTHKSLFSLCAISIYLLIIFLIQTLRLRTKQSAKIDLSRLHKKHIIYLSIILFAVVFYSNFIDQLLGSKANVSFDLPTAFLLATLLMVILLTLGVGMFLHRLFINSQLLTTNELIVKQLAYQLTHYQQLERNIQETRKIKHDMNNHFLCLSHLLLNNDTLAAQAYLSDIKSSIDKIECTLDTGNSIIDAIINDKLTRNKDNHIIFNLKGTFPPNDFIKLMDLCTIISNSFDNAIEACLELPQNQPRTINIETYMQQGYWIYKINNSCKERQSQSLTSFQTTKYDYENHGFGLSNIQNAVKKYDGELNYQFNNCEFLLEVAIILN